VLKKDFKERIAFYDSASTPVVRIADVLVTVVRWSAAANLPVNVVDMVRGRCLGGFPYALLKWTDEQPAPGPNPYLA
jgi:hypothetical protein